MIKNTSSFLEPINYVWQNYIPTFTQSATITKTVNWARYTQLGKWVQVSIRMTATSAGTANNLILIGLPVNASSNNFLMGTATTFVTTTNPRFAIYQSTSTVQLSVPLSNASNPSFHGLTAGDAVTVANGHIYSLNLEYEAA